MEDSFGEFNEDGGQFLGGGLQLEGFVQSSNYHGVVNDTHGFELD